MHPPQIQPFRSSALESHQVHIPEPSGSNNGFWDGGDYNLGSSLEASALQEEQLFQTNLDNMGIWTYESLAQALGVGTERSPEVLLAESQDDELLAEMMENVGE